MTGMAPRRGTRAATRFAAPALAVLGLGLLGAGLVPPAKAMLGQFLLDRAWTSGAANPWPGSDLRPVARLVAPRIGAEAVVLDSASGKALAWGPGHVAGTALPGDPGVSGIGGHRDSHLAFIGGLRPGDRVDVERADGGRHAFTVSHGVVVDSRHWRYPAARSGPAVLALTTCWPIDDTSPGPLRLVVFADLADGAADTTADPAGLSVPAPQATMFGRDQGRERTP